MKIGILSKNYAAQRLFLNKVKDGVYKDLRFNNFFLWKNAHLWFLKTIGRLNMSPEEQASKLFYDYKSILPTGCDILHFFNTINHSKNEKWVISVESAVPWTLNVIRCVESKDADLSSIKEDPYVKKALDFLAAPSCKGLLALSECSHKIQLEILKQFPEYKEDITKKLRTLHPAQKLFIDNFTDKGISYDGSLTLCFVGSDFFRKGGIEMLNVLSKLKKEYDFKLILISSLRVDEPKYVFAEHDVPTAQKIISQNADWIEYHDFTPNEIVIQKLKSSHIALLPTWMDTYAYSVLECQACGTPVVSTSLRALTEINPSSAGWMIDVPVNRLNHPLHNTQKERELFQSELLKGLEMRLREIFENPEDIKIKAQNGIERIKNTHSPNKYNQELERIYTAS